VTSQERDDYTAAGFWLQVLAVLLLLGLWFVCFMLTLTGVGSATACERQPRQPQRP
jgi:hypothetical protein